MLKQYYITKKGCKKQAEISINNHSLKKKESMLEIATGIIRKKTNKRYRIEKKKKKKQCRKKMSEEDKQKRKEHMKEYFKEN